MRIAVIAALALLNSPSANAQDADSKGKNAELRFSWPVTFENLDVGLIPGPWTPKLAVITLKIRNGPHALNFLGFECQAKNRSGNVWRGTKGVLKLDANETRIVKVRTEGGGWFHAGPDFSDCQIAGYIFTKSGFE